MPTYGCPWGHLLPCATRDGRRGRDGQSGPALRIGRRRATEGVGARTSISHHNQLELKAHNKGWGPYYNP
jgi:hypothetical protein